MNYVIDVEFVVDAAGKRYIKEFTLVRTLPGDDVEVCIHTLIKPPCAWSQLPRRQQACCSWLRFHHHGIHFSYGVHTLAELKEEVEQWIPSDYVVYTKGQEKADVLVEVLDYPVVSLEEAPITADCTGFMTCRFDHSRIHCSKRKAVFYARWLKENPEQPSPAASSPPAAAVFTCCCCCLLSLSSLNMSKRATFTSPATVPAKRFKEGNIWNSIPDDNEKREFKPVEGGPKTKLQKSFVLNYNPRVDVSISLNACFPEVRFSTPEGCFYMTGNEFLTISGQGGGEVLDKVKLEPTEEEGYRLARYLPTESGMPDLEPVSVLHLNMYAVKRLKSKLEPMCEHVCALRESEPVIRLMFDCIADVYKKEHRLTGSSLSISDQFEDLSRFVETYVPAVVIVKDFLERMFEKRLLSQFNHYHLCAVTMAQKYFIQHVILS